MLVGAKTTNIFYSMCLVHFLFAICRTSQICLWRFGPNSVLSVLQVWWLLCTMFLSSANVLARLCQVCSRGACGAPLQSLCVRMANISNFMVPLRLRGSSVYGLVATAARGATHTVILQRIELDRRTQHTAPTSH